MKNRAPDRQIGGFLGLEIGKIGRDRERLWGNFWNL